MSTYYSYYLTKTSKEDNLIHFFGPFDSNGKACPVIEDSRSFASDLYEDFNQIGKEKLSKEIIDRFGLNEEGFWDMKYLPMKEISNGSLVKKGYVPIKEVQIRDQDYFAWCNNDGFSEILTPEAYAGMLIAENSSKFPPATTGKDCEGMDIQINTAKDYMYYAWEQPFNNAEYDKHLLHMMLSTFYDYKDDSQEYGVFCIIG